MPTRAPLSPQRSKPGSALRLRSSDSWAQRTGRGRKPHLRGSCGGGEGWEPEPRGGGRGARAHVLSAAARRAQGGGGGSDAGGGATRGAGEHCGAGRCRAAGGGGGGGGWGLTRPGSWGPRLFIYLFLVGFAGRVSAPSLLGGEGVGGGPAPRGSWSRGRNAA